MRGAEDRVTVLRLIMSARRSTSHVLSVDNTMRSKVSNS